MRISRQEFWSGEPFPSSGDLPHPGIEPTFLEAVALAGRFFYHGDPWEALLCLYMGPGQSAKTFKNAVFWKPRVQRGRSPGRTGPSASHPGGRPNSRGLRSRCSRPGLPPQRCLRGVGAHSGPPSGDGPLGAPPCRLCSPSPRPVSDPSGGRPLPPPAPWACSRLPLRGPPHPRRQPRIKAAH